MVSSARLSVEKPEADITQPTQLSPKALRGDGNSMPNRSYKTASTHAGIFRSVVQRTIIGHNDLGIRIN